MMLRIELNALVGLLVEKGVITLGEFTERLNDEAAHLCDCYERAYPGIIATDEGLSMDVEIARQTMARMNFRP